MSRNCSMGFMVPNHYVTRSVGTINRLESRQTAWQAWLLRDRTSDGFGKERTRCKIIQASVNCILLYQSICLVVKEIRFIGTQFHTLFRRRAHVIWQGPYSDTIIPYLAQRWKTAVDTHSLCNQEEQHTRIFLDFFVKELCRLPLQD